MGVLGKRPERAQALKWTKVWHNHGMGRRVTWLKLGEGGVEGRIGDWKGEQEPDLEVVCGH